MGTQLVSVHVTELQRRITQLTPTAALNALNKAYEYIHDQGSFIFDLTGNHTTTALSAISGDDPDATFGTATLPLDCDSRKLLFVFNASGLPIVKTPIHRLWDAFAVNNTPDQGYTTYTITADGILLLRPNQSAGATIGIRYHRLFVALGLDDHTYLPTELEKLAIDLAECDERRIYDVGEQWIKRDGEVRAMIAKALDGYRTPTMEPMPMEEAVASIQETTKLGRA